jgi:pSer/pThr/pTyr-binding forkhead associated (FHA) protein
MSNKFSLNNVTNWWHALTRNDEPRPRGRYCSAGHAMDPNWNSCPQCDSENRSREKTALEQADVKFDLLSERNLVMARGPTGVFSNEPKQDSNAAKPAPSVVTPHEVTRKPHQRKITGALVTFSWRPEGQLFVLYEGRNVIGSGTVESEGGRDCDVQISTDETLSNEHAVILCRVGRYQLFDRQSTNGTFVNGAFIDSQGVNLPDGAKIKTGATIWIFRTIEVNRSDSGTVVPVDFEQEKPPAPDPG